MSVELTYATWQTMGLLNVALISLFDERMAALSHDAESLKQSRRRRSFFRLSIASARRSGVVSRLPHARLSQLIASSVVRAVWVSSMTVSSRRVRGGTSAGCRACSR